MLLSPIEEDGEPHVASYNEELNKLEKPSWYNAPWLYLECYLYRYEQPEPGTASSLRPVD